MARCQLAAGDAEKAKQILESAPEDKKNDPLLAGVLAAVSLAEESIGGPDLATARAKAEGAPSDNAAQFDLAKALLGSGAMDDAIDTLLKIIERDRDWNDGAAREKLLYRVRCFGRC